MSKFGDELVYEAKPKSGGFVQGWLGPMYPTPAHPCPCGQEKEGWLFDPWAQRTMGVHGYGFRITARFDGTPKYSDETKARALATNLAKLLEALPDWTASNEA